MKTGKRVLSMLLVAALLLSCTVTVFAATVLAVDIATLPTKLTYAEGEALDVTGGELTVYYSGSQETIPITEDMVTGFDSAVTGTQTLTVSYAGAACTYDVVITPKPASAISVTTLPAKLTYVEGKDSLDVTGGEVTVSYADGTPSKTIPMTLDMVTGFDNTVIGTQTLTITYGGATATYQVEVVEPDVSSISVAALPNTTSYLLNQDDLDVTGGELTVTYNNDTSAMIPMTAEMVTGFDNTILGKQTLTVTYEGKTTKFTIEICQNNNTEFLGGLGTVERPYIIKTKEHLDHVRNYLGAHYMLVADIEFTEGDFAEGGAFYNGGAGWQPIGTSAAPFSGVFDGNGHTIKGLQINITGSSTAYAGLFGYVKNCAIQNLGMVDGCIEATVTSSFNSANAGGIAGYAASGSTITNCCNTGSVTATSSSSDAHAHAGGIAGDADGAAISNCCNTGSVTVTVTPNSSVSSSCAGGIAGIAGSNTTISNCHNTGSVSATTSTSNSSDAYAGGIAGYAYIGSTISNCHNTGSVSATTSTSNSSDAYAGGIAGHAYSAAISACYNTGSVTATSSSSDACAGGIAGYAYIGSTISNCHNTGSVTATSSSSDARAGGIAGYAYSNTTISNCCNTGSVTATATSTSSICDAYAGGIAGYAYSNTTISNCYNTGSVTATTSTSSIHDAYAGGIAGYVSSADISNCHNTGGVTATSSSFSSYAGGIAGRAYSDTTITNCYYLNRISKGVGAGTDTAMACTAEQMQQQETFAGFDFDTVWTMEGHEDFLFPELQTVPMVFTDSVVDVSMATLPDKLTFAEEAPLDVSGGMLKVSYLGGRILEVPLTASMVTGFDPSTPGQQSVTVTYEGKTTTYTVTITHNYTATVTAPTCTNPGYTTHTCGCGESYVDSNTAALGHAWDAGTVTTAPTATTDGVRTYTCTRCGATRTEAIPATGNASCDGGTSCPSAYFTDAPKPGNWAHAGVDYAVSNGLFNGMSDTTFEPGTAMTRAMLVTVLWRYAGQPVEGSNQFADVENGKWYTKPIAWASANGIVNGVSADRFDPMGVVTREQLATILYRYCGAKGIDNSAQADLSAFPDVGSVSSYAKKAVSWAVAEGIIGGNKINGVTCIDPKGNATRAQVATIMMRFIENVVK